MENSTRLDVHPIFERNRYRPLYIDNTFYFVVKRIIDVIISVMVLIFLTPLLVFIALLIKLDSPGPVFFKQARVGSKMHKLGTEILWEREPFYCYKFRTMIHNSKSDIHKKYIEALIQDNREQMEKMEGEKNNLHKLVNDNRITRVGKYLRKYSLDEIPQFINVIKGDMSVVGPRPAIPYEVEMYRPLYLRRLEAKPGITGLQQITARCTESFDKQVNLDIQYIKNQSLGLDLKIIVKTPLAIFTQKGV